METPRYPEKIVYVLESMIDMVSPFENVEIAFNWLNTDYPFFHQHTHWELFVIMSGEISHNINGVKSLLKQGDACLIRPTDRHQLKFIQGECNKCQHINFVFGDDMAQQLFAAHNCYNELIEKREPIQFTLDESEIAMVYDKALLTQNLPREKYEASTKIIVSRILLKLFEQRLLFHSEYPKWFNEFLIDISNPKNFGKTVEELAQYTPYSYSRLARLFKQYTGVNIITYVNEQKMVYAKRLLRSTKLKILPISERLGYSSLSTFNHTFKNAYGITPTEYRKEHCKKSAAK